jgi:predicted nucleic acid-binding protein
VPSQVCVDASLAVRWVVPEDYSEQALDLLEDWGISQTELFAPTHMLYEVHSTLRFLVSRGVISDPIGDGAFSRLRRLRIRYTSRAEIFPLATQLARELNLPTTYDTVYLALAQLLECEMWTADRKFYNAARLRTPKVKWIGEYASH